MATVACNANLDAIFEDECLGSSLTKINSNFNTLQQILWSLRERVDSRVEIRTFFYYGPNAAGPVGSTTSSQGTNLPILSPAGSGMDDNKTTRPSNLTIEAFINSSTQINLPAISKSGDIAYVIYQKTGFLSPSGSLLPSLQNISTTSIPQNVTDDVIVQLSPVFIIWKLTCSQQLIYLVDQGYPKFHRAQTSNTSLWSQPQLWNEFTEYV